MFTYIQDLHFAVFAFGFRNSLAFSSYMAQLGQTYFPVKIFQPNYDNHLVIFRAITDWAETNIFSSSVVQTTVTFTHEYLSTPLACLAPAYVVLLALLATYLICQSIAATKLFTLSLTIAEQEFATPRAIALLLTLLLCMIFSNIGGALFGTNLTSLKFLYLTSIALLVYLVALLPINLIYNWGTYFPIYIKGQSIKKNIIIELMTDYIHILSFFLRINIQLIRLVIITCTFYLYNEMYVEFIYPTLNSTPANSGILGYIYAGAAFALKLIANVLYEIGHLWIMVGMQSGAFMMIIFVITQFLYSIYLIQRLQPFLLNLRAKK